MKYRFTSLLIISSLWACQPTSEEHQHDHTQATAQEGTQKSPSRTAMDNIGDTHVHITYNAPSVRGRTIWGGLVAYDEVWVTGAHNATTIAFYEDVVINGQTLPKGKYAFFTIPSEEEWSVIFNKNWEQHLTDEYDAKEDVLRFQVKPQESDHTEQLLYKVVPGEKGEGKIVMQWEKIKIEVEVKA